MKRSSNAQRGSCLKATPIACLPDAVENAPDSVPDASPFSVVVEHPVPLLPDDVLRLLPHDVLHHALQLDR